MDQQDPQRRVAQYRLDRLAEEDRSAERDGLPETPPSGTDAERPRPRTMAERRTFADELVRQAMARGEFDNLPLSGKPIPGINGPHDPDWWLKSFIEREQITGVLPEALQLRKDDAALDDRLDREHREAGVRQVVEEFNARVVEARRQLLGGPPVVTPVRDVEVEIGRWHERRREREAAARTQAQPADDGSRRGQGRTRRGARWWRRG